MNAEVTDDGRYAVLQVWLGTDRRNRVYYLDLKEAKRPKVTGEVVRLLDDFDASYAFVGNDGPVFYFLTDLDAPRKRVIAIDTRHPERAGWREVIPQAPDVLDGVQIIHDTFVANYMHDASSRLRLFARDGRFVKDLPLPTLGSIGAISGERKDDEMFYAFTSFLYPTTIFRYAFKSGVTSVFKAPAIDFDPSGYETKQVFYTSKDGTRVPMFITHKKGLHLDGSNPTYLYGYGGFNISLTPSFSVSMLVWLQMGGVYAVPNLRGGGHRGAVPLSLQVLAAAQHQGGNALPGHPRHDRRSRRSRRAGAFLQVHGGAPGGAGGAAAGVDRDRNEGRARGRQADQQADRGAGGPVCVSGEKPGDAVTERLVEVGGRWRRL